VKGRWSAEEDRKLIAAVQKYPDIRLVTWTALVDAIPGRTSKQCRERWFNFLDPSIKHNAEWTMQEDKKLQRLVKSFGRKWARIAKELPGRTENTVKVRYQSLERQMEHVTSHSSASNILPTSSNPDHNSILPRASEDSAFVSDDSNSCYSEREVTRSPRPKKRNEARNSIEPKSLPINDSALTSPDYPAPTNNLPVSDDLPPSTSSVPLPNVLNDISFSSNNLAPQSLTSDAPLMLQQLLPNLQASSLVPSFLPLNTPITPAVISLIVQQQHQEAQFLQGQIDHLQLQLLQLQQLQQLQQIKHLDVQLRLQQYLSSSQCQSENSNRLGLNPHDNTLGKVSSCTSDPLTSSSAVLTASLDQSPESGSQRKKVRKHSSK
jgi:hypothetical protein